MTVWTENLSSVLTALRTIGVSLTFTRKAVASVTGGEPTFTTPSTTATGTCVPLPPSLGKGYPKAWGKGLEDASLANAELMFLWVAASGMAFAPRALDTVSINSATWKVLGCDEYPPTVGTSVTALAYGVGVQKT